MKKQRPIAVDLFAGAGGMSLGFEQAGFDVLAAVEIDPIHAAIHHYNFPYCTVIPQSVTDLTGQMIREESNIDKQAVDVVFGGPPCQGFSQIGQRMIDDPRNLLVKEFVRLVAELDAKYFVFENVKGLTLGKHRKFLDELIHEFGTLGYNVTIPWQVLNASDFGVPQSRERVILIGAKCNQQSPKYPSPSVAQSPTCGDALNDLPNIGRFKELHDRDWVETESWGKPSAYARTLRSLTAASWKFGYKRKYNSKILSCSLRTEHTETSKARFAHTSPGNVEPISRFFKLARNGIANTLRAGTDSSRGAFTSPRPIHYKYPRCITVREMARLHGFPDWFRFHETKWHGARQVGNAVPPPLAYAIARQIIKVIGVKTTKPSARLALGNVELLRMNMSQAAKYWNIKIPIAKRKRNSSTNETKQIQTDLFAGNEVAHG